MNYDKMYGLVGMKLGHSFSKDYFTKKFSELNLDYTYQNIEIENIVDIIPFIKENKNLKGFNVTVPYKEEIIPYLNDIDQVAKEVGAVNTVKVYDGGRLKGFNTDVIGFEKLLDVDAINHVLTEGMKEALILGSGGASKAVQYVFNKKNIPFKIVSRHPKNDKDISYDKVYDLSCYSLIINTTPVGMFPNVNECLELPYSTIGPDNVFIDLIYNPEETLFMKKARQNGAVAFNGLTMLHEQAEAAWEIWDS